MSTRVFLVIFTSLTFTLQAGCVNSKNLKKVASTAASTASGFTHQIASAQVGTTTGGANVVNVNVTAIAGAGSLSNYCTTTSPCSCSYSWTYSGVARSDTRPMTSAGPASAVCPVPLAWAEINLGEMITLQVSSANNSVRMAPFSFTNGGEGVSLTADFSDSNGSPYRNIYRYTCFEAQDTFRTILNQITEASETFGSNTRTLRVAHAARFCPGGISGATGCEVQGESPSPSNLMYPYDLYSAGVPTAASASNSRYFCPSVRRSVNESASFYPLDSTFALRPIGFPGAIPVEANSRISNPQDATSAADSCRGGASSTQLNNSSLSAKCLGWAYPANADGSCGSVAFENRTVQLVRLRRFYVIYPPTIQINGTNTGKVKTQAQAVNSVLVADRPLERVLPGGQRETIGAVNGFLPCPMSVFDSSGVTGTLAEWNLAVPGATRWYDTRHGGIPAYVPTSRGWWKHGAPADGGSYPAIDYWDDESQTGSCSAAWPIFDKEADRVLRKARLKTAGIPANRSGRGIGPTINRPLYWNTPDFALVELGGVGNIRKTSTIFEGTSPEYMPDWQEDREFKACVLPRMVSGGTAGTANVRNLDPPIHQATVNVFLPDVGVLPAGATAAAAGQPGPTSRVTVACAETLPTQNPYIKELELGDKPRNAGVELALGRNGLVNTFTSHYKKNGNSQGAPCVATPVTLPLHYPTSPTLFTPLPGPSPFSQYLPTMPTPGQVVDVGAASHGGSFSSTCDKTVVKESVGESRKYFPLLQNAADTEFSIRARPDVYGCFVRGGTAAQGYQDDGMRTPPSCCSKLTTGLSGTESAHFEPNVGEDCGNPVE